MVHRPSATISVERPSPHVRFLPFADDGGVLYWQGTNRIWVLNQTAACIYPILDLSWGGLRFESQNRRKKGTRLTLKLLDPYEEEFLVLKGEVKWGGLHSGQSYAYQIGVQFQPYGPKRGQNPPECREKLIMLENQFSSK